MVRIIGALVMMTLITAACGQQYDNFQGSTNREDIENMSLQDENTSDAEYENPRSMDRVGDTWGLKQDREMMKEAANQVPGVTVKRVIIEAGQAWVTVSVDRELSSDEEMDWSEQIKDSVYSAVPRYNINVKIR
ncbi:hypothetical protein MUO14_08605 [Halobacillus shinanisalinarum]|uniref:Sporulation lipoprotein YhcN/YlaJ n=1 Tax=Halobacillus shinanisalinarum TaxID=2932258 RepID=A0ABY4H436_9BACI|nr:hypothetical protein [Halobacillus shinanisalinarum]UOQ94971.1 hypothetical protein MUO14_08605 [Halobacillus shinanisalinarum]